MTTQTISPAISRAISTERPLRIGTRGSLLALAQAHETRDCLMAAHGLPESAFEIVVITTTGDRVQDRALSKIGGKGLFTKEIEEAMLDGRADIAVHSMKDAPTYRQPGLELITYLPREDARDAFICPGYANLMDLPQGATVGSSSLRRRAQALARRPDLKMVEFRGNVQTRMRKLDEGVAEATFLACAGLNRLNASSDMAHAIDPDVMLPAVAQGAIGIEARSDDAVVHELLAVLDDADTRTLLTAERAFLKALDGSCRTPLAGLAEYTEAGLRFRGEILRPDGSECHATERSGPVGDAETMGLDAADELRSRGGPGFFTD
jgi:hydroxymethylbilane synthase